MLRLADCSEKSLCFLPQYGRLQRGCDSLAHFASISTFMQDHLQHGAEDFPGPDQDPLSGWLLSLVRLQSERAAIADTYTLLFP